MIATYPGYVDTYGEAIERDEALGEVTSWGALPHAYPHYLVKLSQVVVGPEDWVVLPTHHPDPVVYGTELTVVIGARARKVSEEEASDHIWGYTILNGLTLLGRYNPNSKVFDNCASVGPWIAPSDQVADPGNVDLSFRLNGKQTQSGNTRNLKFSIASMVAEVSKWLTLNPGDIIATGDLGTAEYLKAGDIMEAEIEGIGVLSNPVKLEED
jgi:2-keto-4-pentenoate hydratase/2-oxohepta-3-ene-1,7-dioic acid hydratase in catechol pathway